MLFFLHSTSWLWVCISPPQHGHISTSSIVFHRIPSRGCIINYLKSSVGGLTLDSAQVSLVFCLNQGEVLSGWASREVTGWVGLRDQEISLLPEHARCLPVRLTSPKPWLHSLPTPCFSSHPSSEFPGACASPRATCGGCTARMVTTASARSKLGPDPGPTIHPVVALYFSSEKWV